jgi:4-hydroxybenzoate polyprenyltransferase
MSEIQTDASRVLEEAPVSTGEDNNSDTPVPSSPSAAPRKTGGMAWRIGGMIKTARPHQWVKNLFVLAPVFFAKDILKQELLLRAFGAFAIFCLLASAVYTMNDVVDVEADRVHPIKRLRPIASGRVPLGVARAGLVGLIVVSFAASMLMGPWAFFVTAAAYFVQNVAYSLRLKKIAYVDVGCIALGFVLRVVAGGFGTGIHVSWYLLACTALLALFLGFGKRRHELAQAAHNAKKQRAALEAYTPRALTVALAITGFATVLTYVAYTLDPATRLLFRSEWLWLTTPFTIFGVLRFLKLVRHSPKAESPTQEMLRDTPFVLNLVAWAIVIGMIVYRLRPEVQ